MSTNMFCDRNVSGIQAIDEEDAEDENIYANTVSHEVYNRTQESKRNQPCPHTASTEHESMKNRSRRSVLVCLVVLCVLLLTAVIVLCVLIYTKYHECNSDPKKSSEQWNLKKSELWKHFQVWSDNLDWLCSQMDGFTINPVCTSTKQNNWTESRRYCSERGADLIIINNKEEQNFVKNMSGTIWIGLSDSVKNGTWEWVDGSTLTSSFWKSGEPQGIQKCVVNHFSEWVSVKCQTLFKSICEKKL